jgi:hypothetical protein
MTEPPPKHNKLTKEWITGKFRRSKLVNQVLFVPKIGFVCAQRNVLHI